VEERGDDWFNGAGIDLESMEGILDEKGRRMALRERRKADGVCDGNGVRGDRRAGRVF